MNHLKLYETELIPNLNLEGLLDQRYRFEGMEHPVDKAIYNAICKRISELEMLETLKN